MHRWQVLQIASHVAENRYPAMLRMFYIVIEGKHFLMKYNGKMIIFSSFVVNSYSKNTK